MKLKIFILLILMMSLSFVLLAKEQKTDSEPLSAKQVLDKLDDLWRGKSSTAEMTMEVKTRHWHRTMVMNMWSKGTDYSMVRVVKPLKERGTATLKVKEEIYNYLPKTDRTIKLTAAMMMGSWMGSHFTNDDLVKESRMADDYTYKMTINKDKTINLVLIPKEEAAVVWGKIEILVREDYQPIKFVYYDEDGEISRTMTFDKYEKVGNKLVPLVMKMTPADKQGEYTLVSYKNLKFDIKIKNGFFSLNQLRR